jgi:1-aminocyclopropane-1-carboxylate deaminase/D-cysteine desulfhydrase-like pyridoxal-dependent ACC family enzyme
MRAFQSDAMERLLSIPRLRLANWPTPLDTIFHPQLGRVLIKRDDLAGFGVEGRSGVKARKLEVFLENLRSRRIPSLVMALGNLTSLAFDLAREAKSVGIDVRYLVVDDPPLPYEKRREIFAPILDRVQLLGPSYAAAFARLFEISIRSRRKGTRTMITLPSPAHPTAIAGVARGYIEAMQQAAEMEGSLPRGLYIAAASGSTAAGLALGEALMRAAGAPPVEIVAVRVGPQPLSLWIRWLIRWTARYWKLERLPDRIGISVIKDPRHLHYGRFDDAHEDTCRRVLEQFGLPIDPIYGGKSWAILEERERAFAGRGDRPALFWHCGYTPNWRDYRAHLRIDG